MTRTIPEGGPRGLLRPAVRWNSASGPAGAPFPSVAGYRIEAEAVRRKGIHGTSTRVTVLGAIEPWEFSLPDVASVFASGPQFVSPRIDFLLQTPAGGVFPLCLRRQALACPASIISLTPRSSAGLLSSGRTFSERSNS